MKVLATLAFLTSLAAAKCYKTGVPWPGNHAGTVQEIQGAAQHFASLSPLPRGEHYYDVSYGGKCLHFVLDNISGKERSIPKTEAEDGFLKEYRGCSKGGDSRYTNWRYV